TPEGGLRSLRSADPPPRFRGAFRGGFRACSALVAYARNPHHLHLRRSDRESNQVCMGRHGARSGTLSGVSTEVPPPRWGTQTVLVRTLEADAHPCSWGDQTPCAACRTRVAPAEDERDRSGWETGQVRPAGHARQTCRSYRKTAVCRARMAVRTKAAAIQLHATTSSLTRRLASSRA